MKKDFKSSYGPWAIVAGASAGIGAAYAAGLAKRGINLVLLARREKELGVAAEELKTRYNISVITLRADLAEADFIGKIKSATKGIDIGLAIYNATFPAIGAFLEQPLADHMRLIDINIRALVMFTHYFGTYLKSRGRGGLILMSSLSAFFGTPYISAYGASKAFTLALGEGLSRELKGTGVDLLVCCPGATRTESFVKSIPIGGVTAGIPIMDPKDSVFMRRVLTRKSAVKLMQESSEKLYGAKAGKR
jgi:short-subunit dehydrogenase